MSTVWKFLILAACLYAGIFALVYFQQSSLIYYPNIAGRSLDASPQQIGLAYEDVELLTEDKVRLHGWLSRAITHEARCSSFTATPAIYRTAWIPSRSSTG